MSIDRNDYIVVGVDIINLVDMEEYRKDEYDDLMDQYSFRTEIGEITFIQDYYSDKYFIVGEILDSGDYTEGLDYNFQDKDEQIKLVSERVKLFIKEHFGIDTAPSVIVKTQWN